MKISFSLTSEEVGTIYSKGVDTRKSMADTVLVQKQNKDLNHILGYLCPGSSRSPGCSCSGRSPFTCGCTDWRIIALESIFKFGLSLRSMSCDLCHIRLEDY